MFAHKLLIKNIKHQKKEFIEEHILLQIDVSKRKDHPRIGVRKIYFMIKEDMYRLNIKIGRDALFDLMASEHMLVQRRKRKHITTNSNHWYRKYPNLIRGITPDEPNQLWVSDITYIKTQRADSYIFFLLPMLTRRKYLGID